MSLRTPLRSSWHIKQVQGNTPFSPSKPSPHNKNSSVINLPATLTYFTVGTLPIPRQVDPKIKYEFSRSHTPQVPFQSFQEIFVFPTRTQPSLQTQQLKEHTFGKTDTREYPDLDTLSIELGISSTGGLLSRRCVPMTSRVNGGVELFFKLRDFLSLIGMRLVRWMSLWLFRLFADLFTDDPTRFG